MDEETWEDPGVAALVGRVAVPVRVDADARPDVYARYHLGGLPTTALLAETGDFIRGGTYFSPAEIQRFLDLAIEDWRGGRRPARRATVPASEPENLADEIVRRLLRRADVEHGGLGVAPKLAETEGLTLLLRRWRASRDGAIERVVRASLDAIVAHLADPRDGGFFRYAAGADWSGPHTEKVALDQGQIARLLLEAGVALDAPGYVDAARAGLAHARRRLADQAGRVFGSVAAEPGYYAGGLDRAGPMPPVDERRFADGGASMVSAALLARAITGEDFGFRPEFREASPSGSVPHRLDAAASVEGLLRDQALALTATLAEYRLCGDRSLIDWCARAADWTLAHLWDEAASAFRAEPEALHGAVRLPAMFPLLANGEMAVALADLADHAGRAQYRVRAERVVSALGGRAVRSPAGAALALAAQRLEDRPPEADLDGDPADPRARDLARSVVAALGPAAVVRWSGAGAPGLMLCVRELCLRRLDDRRALVELLADLGLAPRGILAHWLNPSSD